MYLLFSYSISLASYNNGPGKRTSPKDRIDSILICSLKYFILVYFWSDQGLPYTVKNSRLINH